MRLRLTAAALLALLSSHAWAFDAGSANRYPSPDLYRPNVDSIILKGGNSSGPIDGMNSTATGGSVARSVKERANDLFGVRDLGAKGDGTTNDFQAFANAMIARGKDVFVPPGTYVLNLTDGGTIGNLPAGLNVRGAGRDVTKIIVRTSSATYVNAMSAFQSDVRFSDLELRFEVQAGQTAALFLPGGGGHGLTFDNVRLSANGSVSGGITTSCPILLNVAGDFDGVTFNDSEVTGWCYPVLKSNNITANNKNWTFRGGYFHDNTNGDININSPLGSFSGIDIDGVTFGPGIQSDNDAGMYGPIALASVSNVRVTGVQFTGYTSAEAIHIEEASGQVVLSNNILRPTSTRAGYGKGIAVLNNNVGGTRGIPTDLVITNNVIIRFDGVNDGTGIDVVYDSSGQPGGARYVISNNIVSGFRTGINIPQVPYDSNVTGNLVRGGDTCLLAYDGSLAIHNNNFESCATGILSVTGGMFGKQMFLSVPTLAASSTGGSVVLRGWSQEYGITNGNASGQTLFDLGTIGKRLKGTVRAQARGRAIADEIFGEYPLTYDGTTLTAGTAALEYANGGAFGLGSSAWTLNGGSPQHLRVGVYNGNSTVQPISLQVDFDGEAVF